MHLELAVRASGLGGALVRLQALLHDLEVCVFSVLSHCRRSGQGQHRSSASTHHWAREVVFGQSQVHGALRAPELRQLFRGQVQTQV